MSTLGQSFYTNGVPSGTINGIDVFASSIGARVKFGTHKAEVLGRLLVTQGLIYATVNGVKYLATLNGPTQSSTSNSISGGAVAGIVIGCLAAVALALALLVKFGRREGATYEVDEDKHPDEFVGGDDVAIDMHASIHHSAKRQAMPGDRVDTSQPVLLSFQKSVRDN